MSSQYGREGGGGGDLDHVLDEEPRRARDELQQLQEVRRLHLARAGGRVRTAGRQGAARAAI